jgi:iron-sulfur cluster insertion protein
MTEILLPSLTQSAINRVSEIRKQPKNQDKFLRLTVAGGGCSGFQYVFSLESAKKDDDIEIAWSETENGEKFLIATTDKTSLEFISGAKIDFITELGATYFKVLNPNATANCGCGSSFSV